MIKVFVKLQVLNFDALESYERQANAIMKRYGGSIVAAFEITKDLNGAGEEVHLLQFPDEESFNQYRSDKELLQLADFRDQAISDTQVTMFVREKVYD